MKYLVIVRAPCGNCVIVGYSNIKDAEAEVRKWYGHSTYSTTPLRVELFQRNLKGNPGIPVYELRDVKPARVR